MCTIPNDAQTEATPTSDVFTYVMVQNLTNFKQENDPVNLSFSLDELFAGYLDSETSEHDETPKIDRFRDYLKIKELLQMIQ